MKKSILFFLAICLMIGNPLNAQQGGILKKVTKSMTNELLGKPEIANQEPEPACACEQAEVAMEMGGKLQLDYKELNISILDDGRILATSHMGDQYYIVKDGVTQGPYKPGDPKIDEFEAREEGNTSKGDPWLLGYKDYITKSGEKYLITFGGKSYGPYGQISSFVVTKSKDKFAAIVIENVVVTEDQGKKMDEAIKNAKSEQEKMDLAMKYSREMQQKMMQGGGPTSMNPKFVTNISNANYDILKSAGGTLNGNIKFDDILITSYEKIIDLQMKTVLTLKQDAIGAEELFVNTTNTKYAFYNYGTLTFSDNTKLSELFNPHLVKLNGQVYLAYMYYSPKKNAIMQCKIVF